MSAAADVGFFLRSCSVNEASELDGHDDQIDSFCRVYPRGPLGPNPANDQVVSAAPDEPSAHEKEAARIAEVKRVARSP